MGHDEITTQKADFIEPTRWAHHSKYQFIDYRVARFRVSQGLFRMLLLLTGLSTYLVLLVHELGHCWLARWYQVKVLTVAIGVGPRLLTRCDHHGTQWHLRLFPFGAQCGLADGPCYGPRSLSRKGLRQQIVIHSAGPVFSLLFGGVCCAVSWSELNLYPLFLAGGLSCCIGFYNLLPIPPRDGSHIFRLLLEAFTNKFRT